MRTLFLAVTGLFIAVTACSEGGTSVLPVERTPVAAVALSIPASALLVGQTAHGTATALDAAGVALPGRVITWKSSNAAIASVDNGGMIAGVGPGNAMISAASEGVTNEATLSVLEPSPEPVATVSVALAAGSLNPGQSTQATATTRDVNNNVLAGRSITWSSSNSGVATVNASGVVSAIAAGTADISATSEGKTGSISLTVVNPSPAPVATVAVSLANSSRAPGQTTQATAITRDANNNVLSGRSISWSSANSGVATVSPAGVVTAVAAGTSQITATSEGQSGSATLTVTAPPPPPAPVATVTVALADASIEVGQTTQATATTRDSGNNVLTGRAIAWSSSNTAVATVSNAGLVTALSAGNANIIASSEGQVGNAGLTVQDPPPPPPPGASNEPSGMTQLFDRPFNAKFEQGWSDEFSSNMSFISDASAPKSPSGILRATYPTGYSSAGIGPGSAEVPIPSGTRTVYVSYWGRYSDNWYGHDSGVNKEFYLWGNGNPYMYFNVRCRYTGEMTPDIALQDMAVGGDYDISPNLVPSARVIRGKWFHIEVVAVGNTANTSDGSLDWWLDGVHIGSYKNLRFSSSALHWDIFHFTTIWGGVGGPNVPATQTRDWDHAYMSVRPN